MPDDDEDDDDVDDDTNNNERARLCENERPISPVSNGRPISPVSKPFKEQRNHIDEDKDIDENIALLSLQTPSPVEELSKYINKEYEKMDRETSYINT